jgi:hypothetical protein
MDTEMDEQEYKGFDLTDYDNPNKVRALIDYLKLDGEGNSIVEDDYTYEINPRKVKRGDSPAHVVTTINAFKKLLTPQQRDKINSFLKLLGELDDYDKVRDKIYHQIDISIQKKKSEVKLKEWVDICERDATHISNILYALLWMPSKSDLIEPLHVKAYREAWFGREVVDRREYSNTNDGRYIVLTDEEADKKCREYIEDSLWAFNSDFIISHSKALDFDKGSEAILKAIQQLCESGNDAVRRLIDDMDQFVQDAIDADGRGHFLNREDGTEEEQCVNDEVYYIYRE